MIGYLTASFCLLLTMLNLFTLGLAGWRCRRRTEPLEARLRATELDNPTPPVSIVRPLRGLEAFSELTLRSTFDLDYPDYEVLFCVHEENDPIIPLVEKLLAEQPKGRGRLLIGDDPISPNPKLNNCFKGWQAAMHQWIVLADSNMLAPRDYLQQMLAHFTPEVGLVCSPPLGIMPQGFYAQIECTFLNSFQARYQFCADALGAGYAQGKSMMWRREIVDQAGGLVALASEPAEDAASTKLVRAAGMSVKLVDRPFGQPLGPRSLPDVYQRQARWARLRRASFPRLYASEVFSVSFLPILAGAYAARDFGFEPWAIVTLVAALWVVPEAIMTVVLRWPIHFATPFAFLLRDLLFPVIWIHSWLADDFVWLGNSMTVYKKRR